MAKDSRRVDDLLASVTADMFGDDTQPWTDDALRIERILLDLVRPDPVQPRRVLPERIHFAFHENRLTPTQALRELVQIVQVAARQRGHPFNSVLELLPQADNDREESPDSQLSPEETLLRDLVNLAVTIRDDGQAAVTESMRTSDGVVHVVDSVLLPPSVTGQPSPPIANTVDFIASQDRFSTLTEAIQQAGMVKMLLNETRFAIGLLDLVTLTPL